MLIKKNSSQIMLWTTIIAILCNILWGSAFPSLKILYKEMNIVSSDLVNNITLISLRFLLAGIFLFIWAIIKKTPLFSLTKKQLLLIILLGMFNTTLQYFFFNIGINNTSGIKASILGQVGIFFSVVLAHFLETNDKLTLRKGLGLALGFLGLIVINFGKSHDGLLHFSLLGEGFMILSGLVSALAMFIAKRIGKKLPSLIFTCWQMLIGSTMLLGIGIGMGGNPLKLSFTPLSVVLLIYLALLSSIAFSLWYTILNYRKISELSMFKFIVPLSGTILTTLFVPGEHLLLIHIIALILVCIGIVIVNKK